MRAFFNGRAASRVGSRRAKGSLYPKAILFLCLLFSAGTTWSQSTAWIDSQHHHFHTIPATGTKVLGETFDLVIDLGDATQRAEGVLGLDLDIAVDGAQPVGVPPAANIISSWLLDPNDSLTAQWGNDTLHVWGVRSDSAGTDGNGEVVRFTFKVTDTEIDLSSYQLGGGGLVLVDNVDMKQNNFMSPAQVNTSLSERARQLLVSPSPAHETAHIRQPADGDMYHELLDEWGRVVWESERPAPAEAIVDVTQLPSGIYYLRSIDLQGTQAVMKPLIVR